MQPLHPTTLNFHAEPRYGQVGQFVGFEERDERPRAPGGDRVQILVEIPRPGSADREPPRARGSQPIFPRSAPASIAAICSGWASLVLGISFLCGSRMARGAISENSMAPIPRGADLQRRVVGITSVLAVAPPKLLG